MNIMEMAYKKKSLKFSGFSKEVKKKELLQVREISRRKRLSTIRDCELETQENEEGKVPFKALKKTGIPSRTDMLKRWKEEKCLKQQKEKLIKKPAFKVGFVPKTSSSVIAPTSSGNNSNGSFQKSFSFKVPDTSQLATSHINNRKKECQIPKAPPVKSENSKVVAASLKSPSGHIPFKLNYQKSLQAAKSLKSPSVLASSLKSPIQKPKSAITPQKSAASFQRSATLQSKQILSTTCAVKTSSQTSKTKISNTAPKLPIRTGTTQSSQLKIIHPGSKLPAHSKQILPTVSAVKTSCQTSKTKTADTAVKLPATTERKQFQKPLKPKARNGKQDVPKECNNKLKPGKAAVKNNSLGRDKLPESSEIFSCDISCIQPDESVRSSFAPTNFIFCPPAELSDFSYFNPSLIISKVKNQQNSLRTSSPFKSPNQTNSNSSQRNDKTEVPFLDDVSGKDKLNDSNILSKEEHNKTENGLIEEAQNDNEDAFVKEKLNKLKVIPKEESNEVKNNLVEANKDETDIFVEKQRTEIDVFAEEKQNNMKDLETTNPKKISSLLVTSMQSPNVTKLIIDDDDEVKISFDNGLDSTQNKNVSSVVESRLNKIILSPKEISVPNSPAVAKTNLLLSKSFTNNDKNNIEENSNLNESGDHSTNDVLSLCNSLKDFQFPELISSEAPVSSVITKIFKKSSRPELESINESIETKSLNNTPKSSKKKKQIDENFTPRRSTRLSEKLRKSISWESIFDKDNTPKEYKNTEVLKPMNTKKILESTDFDINMRNNLPVEGNSLRKQTLIRNSGRNVRQSTRLSRKLSNSFESLHNVERPSIMASLDMDEIYDEMPKSSTNLTYDFDNLHLEDAPKPKKTLNPGTSKRVSLLYTPRKTSTRYSSVKGDLISFSPL